MDKTVPKSPEPSKVMTDTTQSSLNIPREWPSPHKRRKLEDVGVKSRIPVRYSHNEHLLKLKRLVDKKEEAINRVGMEMMTLKTKKHHFEFEGYNLEDEQLKLKSELNLITGHIEEIRHFEQQSLQDLEAKYDITIRKLKLEQEQRLEEEKEKVSTEIEQIIGSIQQEHIDQKTQLKARCDRLREQISGFSVNVEKSLKAAKEKLLEKFQESETTVVETIRQLTNDITQIQTEIRQQIEQVDLVESTCLKDVTEKNHRLKNQLSEVQKASDAKQEEIEVINDKVASLEHKIVDIETSITSRTNEINHKSESIMQMKNALLHVEHERRYLHNKLQELKGNIRVYCRIRPPSPGVHPQQLAEIEYPADDNDVDESLCQAISISKELPSSEYLQGQTQARNKTSYTFKFDKVFGPSHQNSQVFDELSQLVQSALDGFNVCVFAYGQTGSGKTWTMSHPGDGMIPLTIHKIFDDISDLKQNGWEYSVEGQFLEIYNETIIDLLANGSGDTKYDIKHDDINGKTTISNLRTIRLNSAQEALMLFNKSALNRSTASTNSNERSSRSHSIFVLNIKGFNAKIGTSCEGCLNLVDLAGSERLNNSQAKGDRLKETQYINKSLSCLGDVIYSLGQPKNNHVPYRNSKLTYLLKHSLGGNSKTLMFVNISPAATNFNESLNSFRFATKVGNTKRGSGIRK